MSYTPRSARKGLTADGSTRAWRKLRMQIPGKLSRCPDGRPPFVHHKIARKDGGQDTPRNLEWRCGKDPDVGRPKGT